MSTNKEPLFKVNDKVIILTTNIESYLAYIKYPFPADFECRVGNIVGYTAHRKRYLNGITDVEYYYQVRFENMNITFTFPEKCLKKIVTNKGEELVKNNNDNNTLMKIVVSKEDITIHYPYKRDNSVQNFRFNENKDFIKVVDNALAQASAELKQYHNDTVKKEQKDFPSDGNMYYKFTSISQNKCATRLYDSNDITCIMDKLIGNAHESNEELIKHREEIAINLLKLNRGMYALANKSKL